jgi:hypothetical protein
VMDISSILPADDPIPLAATVSPIISLTMQALLWALTAGELSEDDLRAAVAALSPQYIRTATLENQNLLVHECLAELS